MMDKFYTTEEASRILGLDKVSLSTKCKRYNIPKFGNVYIISEDDLARLGANTKAGRPRKEST